VIAGGFGDRLGQLAGLVEHRLDKLGIVINRQAHGFVTHHALGALEDIQRMERPLVFRQAGVKPVQFGKIRRVEARRGE
jgi:hypothetical protein